MLVHDPEADKSAASLFVEVGSMSDPDDPKHSGVKYEGLAHFLEHMLFMGTKKYPEEAFYRKFLKENGGSSNAGTSAEYTQYYFDVSENAFPKALDIFSQFFKEPLLSKDGIAREMNAVDSEYRMRLSDEDRATEQIEKSVIIEPEAHWAHFATGSLGTLKKDGIYEEMKKFYDDNYSSNRMDLALVGPQSLDKL